MTPSPPRTRLARLLRALLDTAAVVSLVLLVAVVTVWVGSYWRPQTLSFRHTLSDAKGGWVVNDHLRIITAESGEFRFSTHQFSFFSFEDEPVEADHWRVEYEAASPLALPGKPAWAFAGVRFCGRVSEDHWALILPLWLISLLLGPLPLWRGRRWVRRRRARRRARLGLCPKCGYDLRASPGRCPECGSAQ